MYFVEAECVVILRGIDLRRPLSFISLHCFIGFIVYKAVSFQSVSKVPFIDFLADLLRIFIKAFAENTHFFITGLWKCFGFLCFLPESNPCLAGML